MNQDEVLTIYEPAGCQLCSQTGYFGRTAVYEMMPVTPGTSMGNHKDRPSSKVKEIAQREGMITLRGSAVRLVREGVTSLEEMKRLPARRTNRWI